MAKKRKKKSASKCPEPLNTLIDLAGAATLDYIAYKRRKKRGSNRSRIDPYAAAGVAMGMGKLNTTEDLIMLGGMLGAMGAFDDEPSSVGTYKPLNNRYAWRLNCEDGSEYGIDPNSYETRTEYHEALHRLKYQWRQYCEDGSEYGLDPQRFEVESDYEEALNATKNHQGEDDGFSDYSSPDANVDGEDKEDAVGYNARSNPFPEDDLHVFTYCRVFANDSESYYWTDDSTIKKGDSVVIPNTNGTTAVGVVMTVERHIRIMAPQPIEDTPKIVSKS